MSRISSTSAISTIAPDHRVPLRPAPLAVRRQRPRPHAPLQRRELRGRRLLEPFAAPDRRGQVRRASLGPLGALGGRRQLRALIARAAGGVVGAGDRRLGTRVGGIARRLGPLGALDRGGSSAAANDTVRSRVDERTRRHRRERERPRRVRPGRARRRARERYRGASASASARASASSRAASARRRPSAARGRVVVGGLGGLRAGDGLVALGLDRLHRPTASSRADVAAARREVALSRSASADHARVVASSRAASADSAPRRRGDHVALEPHDLVGARDRALVVPGLRGELPARELELRRLGGEFARARVRAPPPTDHARSVGARRHSGSAGAGRRRSRARRRVGASAASADGDVQASARRVGGVDERGSGRCGGDADAAARPMRRRGSGDVGGRGRRRRGSVGDGRSAARRCPARPRQLGGGDAARHGAAAAMSAAAGVGRGGAATSAGAAAAGAAASAGGRQRGGCGAGGRAGSGEAGRRRGAQGPARRMARHRVGGRGSVGELAADGRELRFEAGAVGSRGGGAGGVTGLGFAGRLARGRGAIEVPDLIEPGGPSSRTTSGVTSRRAAVISSTGPRQTNAAIQTPSSSGAQGLWSMTAIMRRRRARASPARTCSVGRMKRCPRTPNQRPRTSSRSSPCHSKRSSSNVSSSRLIIAMVPHRRGPKRYWSSAGSSSAPVHARVEALRGARSTRAAAGRPAR